MPRPRKASARLAGLGACGLVSALVASGAALAHISVSPGLLVVDETQTLRLSVHNDVDRPMTGLAVETPSSLRVVDAGADDAARWTEVVRDGAVTWSGGPLAPNTGAAFTLDVAVDQATAPGPIEIQAEQLYPDDGRLPWPISVTVVPAEEESQLLTWVIVAGMALLATAGIGLVALRRRDRSLQET